jgi:hypothetical protein
VHLQKGLERVSAVWWGLWALLGAVLLGAAVFGEGLDRGVTAGFGVFVLVAAYIAHRVTCWVIAGFFAPRT